MTFTQIKYFIEVARCLNFTEAAARLYVTQPTLSRQITAIETELNMQLFIRSSKELRLTPGGAVLLEEFTQLMESYGASVKKAREASFGMIGHLNISVIDGLNISEILPEFIKNLEKDYPNIKIHLARASFQSLVNSLYDCTADAVISYDFDITFRPGLCYKNIQMLRPVLAIPKNHPLAGKAHVALADMAGESMVIVNPAECSSGVELVTRACQQYGGYYPQFHFVDKMEDAILWVESGIKCALFNTGMNIMHSGQIKIVPLDDLPPMYTVLAWNPGNSNFALPMITNWFNAYS